MLEPATAFHTLWPYVMMFAAALGAATILPLASEPVFVATLATGVALPWPLLIVATIGNTLGSLTTWWLGTLARRFEDRPEAWPAWAIRARPSPALIQRAEIYYHRFGVWTLLFAWLPIIGDAFAFAAGLFRASFFVVAVLTTIGKATRYGVLAAPFL
jgi:membrane protein YqaA with SNARE-associated domain